MQTVIYATFHDPAKVDQVALELLERGLDSQDLIVLTRGSFRDSTIHDDQGPLNLAEALEQLQIPEGSSNIDPGAVDMELTFRDPFGGDDGGKGIDADLRSEGDLAQKLVALGFGEQMSQSLERTVLSGGALMIMRSPSGPVDDVQAWEIVERYGGTGLAQMRSGPFLG